MGAMDGQVVWITGAGSGIGKALAREYVRRGAAVAISGRRAPLLDAAVAELAAAGGRALAVPCDVTDEASVQAAVQAVLGWGGRLDVAIANAGFGVGGRFTRLDTADWRRQLEVNVIGAATTARAALPALFATGGRVALVGSVAAYTAYPSGAAYCASKAAIRAMGDVLSIELHGTGVSCTTVHPGFVESEIARVDNAGVHDPEREDPRPARLMWKADKAARVIARAIQRRRRELVFTGHGRLAVWASRLFPGLMAWAMGVSQAEANRRALSRSPAP